MLSADIHIKDYINILWRRKWIVISFFFIIVTTVTVATFMQKEIYRASATIIVNLESPDVLSVRDVVKLGETNYFAYRDYIETQQEIIRSRRTAHNVIRNLKLMQREEFKKEKDPIVSLLKKLRIELVRDTRIIRISYDNEEPKLASMIANEFAKAYRGSNIALKTKISGQAESWLREEVEKQKKKVQDSELKLQAYKEESDVLSIENKQDIINDALARLNISYLDAQRRKIQAETNYKSLLDTEEILSLENLPAPLMDNKTIKQLKDEYQKQEGLLVEYRKIYKHKHPKMIRLLENINYIKSSINNEIKVEYNNALNELKTEYNNASQEEAKFKSALDEQKKKALDLERKIIKYNAFKREVETSERILQIVLNRLKETSIATQIQTNNVRIQDMAEIPKKPIKPKKILNIALSIVLGLVGGMGLALFREYMDTTLKDPSEIAISLQLPVLGSVPKVRRDGKKIKNAQDIDLIVEKDSQSLASEVYRTIRTNLLFSINHSSSSKSIVITSSLPKEGKTLTAVSLAIMMANSGERVLLVDADMRRPRIHAIFNDSNEYGLSQFLRGKKDFKEVTKYSGINNLYIVTSGRSTLAPSELLSTKNMKLFLENASFQFSKIIFDTPPVTVVTDAQILSGICTGTVLVVDGKKATKPLLNKSKELLQKVDAKILGVVLNNISLTKDGYSYPQYYNSKYYTPA